MEVVGAVASFIAIGQALAALPKISDTIRTVTGTSDELAALLNELETTRAINDHVLATIQQQTGPLLLSDSQTKIIESLKQDLESVLSKLGNIAQECQKGSKRNGQPRVSAYKWLWRKHKINELSSRAETIRLRLKDVMNSMMARSQIAQGQMVLQIQNISQDLSALTQMGLQQSKLESQDVASLLREIHNAVVPTPTTARDISDVVGQTDGRVRKPDSPREGCQVDESDMVQQTVSPSQVSSLESTNTSQIDTATLSSQEQMAVIKQTSTPEPGGAVDTHEAAKSINCSDAAQGSTYLMNVQATLRVLCEPWCYCRCHKPRHLETPKWLQGVFGSLRIHYDIIPVIGVRQCDLDLCRNSSYETGFNYIFPSWAWNRAISIHVSLDSLTGTGASLCLRVPRIISRKDPIWATIEYHKDTYPLALVEKQYSPVDMNINGVTLLEVSLQAFESSRRSNITDTVASGRSVTSISVVSPTCLVLASDLLKNTETGNRVAQIARWLLLSSSWLFDNDQNQLLVRAARLSDRHTSRVTSKVHEAARGSGDMDKALDEQPWALNLLDNTGHTPLHWAVQMNKPDKVQKLIKRGADLDSFSPSSLCTPLALSMACGSFDITGTLLASNSTLYRYNRIWWGPGERVTIFELAVMFDEQELYRFLLTINISGIDIDTCHHGRGAMDWSMDYGDMENRELFNTLRYNIMNNTLENNITLLQNAIVTLVDGKAQTTKDLLGRLIEIPKRQLGYDRDRVIAQINESAWSSAISEIHTVAKRTRDAIDFEKHLFETVHGGGSRENDDEW